MFRKAVAIAHQFTFPVVISRVTAGGVANAGIGSFVVVNSDGWIVTAAHIIQQLDDTLAEVDAARRHQLARSAIEGDGSLSSKQKHDALHRLGALPPEAAAAASAWWGADGLALKDVKVLREMDLGIGRLEGFDPAMVPAYPLFKDPTKDIVQGVSLVKLGYPFYAIVPQYDATSDKFSFLPGVMPPPSFPMEGILSRIVEGTGPAGLPYPLLWIETSSPGLRGQSGGPTIDEQGAIWAIQSHTIHLPLGFSPKVPGGKNGETEHQFLNVGRGVHASTILGFLDSHGVKYDVSAY